MAEERAKEFDIWIHQESTVISAQSHDTWSLTPEFLASDVAPEEWQFRTATRTGDTVEIEHGPIKWRMTPSELWITLDPDLPLEEYRNQINEQAVTSTLAQNFLVASPYTPVRRIWFYWRFSALDPNPRQWMLNRFLANEPPTELGFVRVQPRVTFRLEEQTVQVTVRNDPVQRQDERFNNAIIFECFVNRIEELTTDEMIQDTGLLVERFAIVEKAINYLLMEEKK